MVAVWRRHPKLLAVFGFTLLVFFIFEQDNCSQMDLDKKSAKVVYQSKLLYQSEFNQVMTDDMSPEVGDEVFYNFVTHQHYICEDLVRLGSATEGGWDACLACTYQLKKPCLVYSFGIDYDFTFDDAVSKKFNCTVRSFDPSMKRMAEYRRDDNIYFYKTGLGKTNQEGSANKRGWRIRNFATLLEEMGDDKKIVDYFKMDIESSEWDSMASMFETDVLQTKVKQFGIEIHIMSKSRFDEIYDAWKALKRLESIGFKRWSSHVNLACSYSYGMKNRSHCYEMVYINTAFLNSPPTTSTALNTSIC